MEPLEPRVLFDAVVDIECQADDCPVVVERPVVVPSSQANEQSAVASRQLVIVDPGVEDAGSLVEELMANTDGPLEVHFLDGSESGIEQITSILSGAEAAYDAIHIFSHGEDGRVQLGNEWVDTTTLVEKKSLIESWQAGLSEDADLLFYGCNLAESENGLGFLNTLAEYSQADVAASDDVTGASGENGDWQLEQQVGSIESAAFQFDDYQHTLGPGEILGTIRDVTSDSNVGVSGVTVTIFDDDNNVAGEATSDASGNYTIAGLNNGQRYRVVFGEPPAGFAAAEMDSTSSGAVVFAEAGGANVDFELHRPEDFCASNPSLAVSCFIQGTHDGQASDLAAIVAVEHDFVESSEKTVLATIGQIGSTYGMAYQTEGDVIFSSAFLKRNSGFGPEGMDAIYLIDGSEGGYLNSSDSGVPIAINLSDFGIDVGTELSSADRGLSDDPEALVLDQWGWDNQFRLGIGDIDISDDGNTLYVMNLNDHDGNGTHGQLVILDISDLSNISLRGTVDIPNLVPGVVDQDLRAFATKFEDGNLFIGVTGTAESTQDRADLKAAVYQLDASETSFSLVGIDSRHVFGDGSGPIDHIPLNYDRGIAYQLNGDEHSANFQPWTNDSSLYDQSGGFLSRPQPLLTDIEFDTDGSMVLAFANRDAYQIGEFDIFPGGGNQTRPGLIAGEILRVERTTSGFELEGGSAAPSNASGPDNLGPNGGEYYFRDNFFSLHQETAMGSLALLPGSGQVVSTMVDPIGINSGGLSRFNNETGGDRFDIELYNLSDPGSAAKGAGLGDLEIICQAAPVEIGNYIWSDADNDGIQDGGEVALAGVLVGLFDDTGTLIATVETDSNGRYLFSSGDGTNVNSDGDLIPEFAYGLDICSDGCDYTVGVFDSNFDTGGALSGFSVTVADVSGTSNDWLDQSDSDAITVSAGSGTAFATNGLTITTDGAGFNNHTFDFGFFNPNAPVNPNNPIGTVDPVTSTGGSPPSIGPSTPFIDTSSIVSGIAPISVAAFSPVTLDGRAVQGGTPIELCNYCEEFLPEELSETGECCISEMPAEELSQDATACEEGHPVQVPVVDQNSAPQNTVEDLSIFQPIESDQVQPELEDAKTEMEAPPSPEPESSNEEANDEAANTDVGNGSSSSSIQTNSSQRLSKLLQRLTGETQSLEDHLESRSDRQTPLVLEGLDDLQTPASIAREHQSFVEQFNQMMIEVPVLPDESAGE